MGLLHTKISDLTSEISRLGGEIDFMKKEQSTFLTYDKRVKEMAQELTGKHIITFLISIKYYHQF